MDSDEMPSRGDEEAPAITEGFPPAEILDELVLPLGSDPLESAIHADRVEVVMECCHRWSDIPAERQCSEEIESIFVYAYDAGRAFVLGGCREEEDEEVSLVEPLDVS